MCLQRCRTMSPLSTMSSMLSRQSRCAPTRHVGARLMIAWARFVSDARGGRGLIFGERGGGYVQSVVDRRDVESQVHFTVFPLSPWWGVPDESIQAGTRHGVLGTNAAGRVWVDACWSRCILVDGSKDVGMLRRPPGRTMSHDAAAEHDVFDVVGAEPLRACSPWLSAPDESIQADMGHGMLYSRQGHGVLATNAGGLG